MSPLPHQTPAHMMVTTATPAPLRPLSMHDDKKVVTDSAQRKLDRKRANARLRQQRCRARKRAKLQQEGDGSVTSNDNKTDDERFFSSEKSYQSTKTFPKIAMKPPTTGSRSSMPTMSHHQRYWQQQPPPVPSTVNQKHENVNIARKPLSQLAPQPTSGSVASWKHPRNASMYPPVPPHYYHHQHQAYGMAWYQWSQAAYYGQSTMHVQQHSQHPPPHQIIPGVSSSPRPQLPPASPVRKSPCRTESSYYGATTPYHQVEEMVKSPMHSLSNIATTPQTKDSFLKIGVSSPENDLLPPLWSTVTKPTLAADSIQSPWSSSMPSPPVLGAATPTTGNSKWNNWVSFHQTPSLPMTTPIKTSNEMGAWRTSPASPSFRSQI